MTNETRTRTVPFDPIQDALERGVKAWSESATPGLRDQVTPFVQRALSDAGYAIVPKGFCGPDRRAADMGWSRRNGWTKNRPEKVRRLPHER